MDASSVTCRPSHGGPTQFRATGFRGKDDLLIAAETCGAEDGQPVVLLPGVGRTRRSWRDAAACLAADGYRVTSIDLRGQGGRGWPRDGDYSLSAYVDDIHAVLRRLGGRVVLIGASIGGVAALLTACEAMHGDVAGLGLVDVLPSASGNGCSSFERFMAHCVGGFDTIDEAGLAATRFFRAGLTYRTQKDLRNSLRRGFDGRWYWHWDPETARRPGDLMRNGIGKLLGARASIDTPTLLVTGAGGDRPDPQFIEAFRALVPGLQWADVSSQAGEHPRPAMQLAVPPVLRFIRANWPARRAGAATPAGFIN